MSLKALNISRTIYKRKLFYKVRGIRFVVRNRYFTGLDKKLFSTFYIQLVLCKMVLVGPTSLYNKG